MLFNFQRKKLCSHLIVGGALCAASLGMFSCSDKYDLDSDQPSGLNSIYGYLSDQGNYTNTLQLIKDLGLTDILNQTGSKTIFAADDDAFNRFFASNSWGVRSYSQLTPTQKKLLLNSTMIDNPFTTSMLSTAEGSVKGEVCRRASSVTIYDSVLSVPVSDPQGILPKNERFNEIRNTSGREQVVLFTDNSTSSPTLLFTAKFLQANKIASTDIDFVFNQAAGTRVSDDVYVNNAKVTEANIFCKNGFVHKVDRVVMPLDNMAEVIRQNPKTSVYNSILERFAAPEYSETYTRAYNQNKGTSIDSVFIKRFFSQRTAGSSSTSSVDFVLDKNGNPMEGGAALKYDPGWNAYLPFVANNRDGMMEDMGVMLVPTNDAINTWWNEGSGAVIKDFYGSLGATPASTLDDLINNNQLVSFVESVPSRFADILNDANESIGITEADVDSVYLACNGLVYLTNKVFAPTSYSSVLFPAVIDTTQFQTVSNAIGNLQYDTYLNSMVARYCLLLPNNTALLSFIDPVSYGRTDGSTDVQVWEVSLDPTKAARERIVVEVYNASLTGGVLTKNGTRLVRMTGGTGAYNSNGSFTANGSYPAIRDRFEDLLDNVIVTEAYQTGKKYYKTKGNTFVRIDGNTDGANIYGSLQVENNTPISISKSYNMENGSTFVLNSVPMSTRNSVASVLNQHSGTFGKFLQLIKDANALYTNYSGKINGINWVAGDQIMGNLLNVKNGGELGAEDTGTESEKVTYLLNNYHYTLYAPTDAAMDIAFSQGLPTHAEFLAAEAWDEWFKALSDADQATEIANTGCCKGDSAKRVAEVYLDFLKYHIQDKSVFLDQGFDTGIYESGKTALIKSTQSDDNGNIYETGKYSPGRPYKLNVTAVSPSGLTVRDNLGNDRHVITTGGLYNLMAREYWIDGTSVARPYQQQLNNSSFVVIHAIDGPLLYADGHHNDESQFKYKYRELTKE